MYVYLGIGKSHNDAASVRTQHPIPAACGLYYFEVKIISKGRDGYMGIGLTAQNFKSNRLPGWDKQSYGYHGDDGNSFSSSGNGKSYGPTFTTDDIIGCGVNLVTNSCFYTKNGHNLGVAFQELPVCLSIEQKAQKKKRKNFLFRYYVHRTSYRLAQITQQTLFFSFFFHFRFRSQNCIQRLVYKRLAKLLMQILVKNHLSLTSRICSKN